MGRAEEIILSGFGSKCGYWISAELNHVFNCEGINMFPFAKAVTGDSPRFENSSEQ
jgi:hypothetical protein